MFSSQSWARSQTVFDFGLVSYLGDQATSFQDNYGIVAALSYFGSDLEKNINGFINVSTEFASPTFYVSNKKRSADFFMGTFNPGFKFNFFSDHKLSPYFTLSPILGIGYLKLGSAPTGIQPTQVSAVYGGALSMGAQLQSEKNISLRLWTQIRNVKANELVGVESFNLSAFSAGCSIGF